MAIPEIEKFIPQGDTTVLDAFTIVNEKYAKGTSISEKMIIPSTAPVIASDYFRAGMGYLANRGYDEYLEEIGTISLSWLNRSWVQSFLTDNILETAKLMGAPEDRIGSDIAPRPNEPHVLIAVNKQSSHLVATAASILTPISFVIGAQKRPIEAVAALARVGSEIRDYASGVAILDPDNITSRAEATQAHFLLEATKRHPDVGLSPHLWNSMTNYPKGVYSLPAGVRYRGISVQEVESTRNN